MKLQINIYCGKREFETSLLLPVESDITVTEFTKQVTNVIASTWSNMFKVPNLSNPEDINFCGIYKFGSLGLKGNFKMPDFVDDSNMPLAPSLGSYQVLIV